MLDVASADPEKKRAASHASHIAPPNAHTDEGLPDADWSTNVSLYYMQTRDFKGGHSHRLCSHNCDCGSKF